MPSACSRERVSCGPAAHTVAAVGRPTCSRPATGCCHEHAARRTAVFATFVSYLQAASRTLAAGLDAALAACVRRATSWATRQAGRQACRQAGRQNGETGRTLCNSEECQPAPVDDFQPKSHALVSGLGRHSLDGRTTSCRVDGSARMAVAGVMHQHALAAQSERTWSDLTTLRRHSAEQGALYLCRALTNTPHINSPPMPAVASRAAESNFTPRLTTSESSLLMSASIDRPCARCSAPLDRTRAGGNAIMMRAISSCWSASQWHTEAACPLRLVTGPTAASRQKAARAAPESGAYQRGRRAHAVVVEHAARHCDIHRRRIEHRNLDQVVSSTCRAADGVSAALGLPVACVAPSL